MMNRAEKNHWAVLALLVLVANVIPPILFLKTDSGVSAGATILLAVALFFVAHRLTCTRRWWILPLLGSPLVVLPLLLGVGFILVIAGVIPVP